LHEDLLSSRVVDQILAVGSSDHAKDSLGEELSQRQFQLLVGAALQGLIERTQIDRDASVPVSNDAPNAEIQGAAQCLGGLVEALFFRYNASYGGLHLQPVLLQSQPAGLDSALVIFVRSRNDAASFQRTANRDRLRGCMLAVANAATDQYALARQLAVVHSASDNDVPRCFDSNWLCGGTTDTALD